MEETTRTAGGRRRHEAALAKGMASCPSDPFRSLQLRPIQDGLGLICIEGSETLKIDSAVVVKDDSFHGCTATHHAASIESGGCFGG